MDSEVVPLLNQLVHQVAKAFYEPQLAILISLLARSTEITDGFLGKLMQLNAKKIRELLNLLKRDMIVKEETRTEKRENDKPAKRTYYRLDFKSFVRVVQYKIIKMPKSLSDKLERRRDNSLTYYLCKVCQKKYDLEDVIAKMNPATGLLECHGELTECKPEEKQSTTNLEIQKRRLTTQLTPILNLLKEIEQYNIPKHITTYVDSILKLSIDESFAQRVGGSKETFSINNGQNFLKIVLIDQDDPNQANQQKEEKAPIPLPWFKEISKRNKQYADLDDLKLSIAEEGQEKNDDDLKYLDEYYQKLIKRRGREATGDLNDDPRKRVKTDNSDVSEGSEYDESEIDPDGYQDNENENENNEDEDSMMGDDDDEENLSHYNPNINPDSDSISQTNYFGSL